LTLIDIPAPIQHPHLDEAALIAIQQHMAQQQAFSQIPDVVKAVGMTARLTCLYTD
jgi:hypothetical protein